MYRRYVIPFLLVAVASSANASANQTAALTNDRASSHEQLYEPGFHGNVALFLGAISRTPAQDRVGKDNERIASFNTRAERETRAVVGPFGDISYTLRDRRTQFFISNPELPMEVGEPSLSFGARHKFENNSVLSVAWVPKFRGVESEVWEDPFVTGAERKETDVDIQGLTIDWEMLFGLPLSLSYGYADQLIDDEHSGEALLLANQLDADDVAMLARSGVFQRIKLSAFLPLSKTVILSPSAHYIDGDTDGGAFSPTAVGGALALVYRGESITAVLHGAVEHFQFKNTHPVFDKTRSDRRHLFNVRVNRTTPIIGDSTRLGVMLSYADRRSNIDFYDEKGVVSALTLDYSF